MFSKAPVLLFGVIAAGHALPSSQISNDACYEGTNLICYGMPGGESQHILVDDLVYMAAYLRSQGQDSDNPAFYEMPARTQAGCDEWTMHTVGTVMALAKHTDNGYKSSVLYTDIANTIDGGGDDATEESKKRAIISCGDHGGQYLVKANTSAPAYNTDAYKKSGAKPTDVLIKIVKNPTP